ncbi:hypothetical protein ACI1TN_10130 [Lactococcus garvieae]|jgi:hypothetical protein|uniref:hypothetical protein n=1 Tax=Lactococcus garvieae TaxID=1363 RepID=UPI0038535319
MDNKCLSDKQFQNAKGLIILLLKLIEKESKGYYRFQKADSTGLFYTTGRGKVNFRISSSERTVIDQITPIIRDISIAQFILDIDLFYRMQKVMPRKGIPLTSRTHEAMMKFLEVHPMFKDQFNQKVKMMIDDGEELMKMFYEDTEVTYK